MKQVPNWRVGPGGLSGFYVGRMIDGRFYSTSWWKTHEEAKREQQHLAWRGISRIVVDGNGRVSA